MRCSNNTTLLLLPATTRQVLQPWRFSRYRIPFVPNNISSPVLRSWLIYHSGFNTSAPHTPELGLHLAERINAIFFWESPWSHKPLLLGWRSWQVPQSDSGTALQHASPGVLQAVARYQHPLSRYQFACHLRMCTWTRSDSLDIVLGNIVLNPRQVRVSIPHGFGIGM